MLRKLFTFLIAAVLFSFAALNAAGADNKDRVLKVMTRNMDTGTDFSYILAVLSKPHTDLDMISATTKTYLEILFSNIPARADGIAAEIQATQPDIIALQEVTKLTTCCPMFQPPVALISDDALASLLAGIEQRGLHYSVLASQKNAEVEFGARELDTGRWVFVNIADSDVILVRDDLQVSDFKLQNTQQAHFTSTLTFQGFPPSPTISLVRGWISLDAKLRGKVYRFVTTHLETLSPDIQAAETEELLAGPLNTGLPVILAGDLNSDAGAPSWARGPAFGILTAGDFKDVWGELRPGDPGFTWPMHPEDSGLNAGPLQRIDLILTKGEGIVPDAIMLTGTSPNPTSGLWASDHAGVVGSLVLLP